VKRAKTAAVSSNSGRTMVVMVAKAAMTKVETTFPGVTVISTIVSYGSKDYVEIRNHHSSSDQ